MGNHVKPCKKNHCNAVVCTHVHLLPGHLHISMHAWSFYNIAHTATKWLDSSGPTFVTYQYYIHAEHEFYNKRMTYCTQHLHIYRTIQIYWTSCLPYHIFMLHMLASNFCNSYVTTICAYIHEPVCTIDVTYISLENNHCICNNTFCNITF